jgi:hypothetical protein
MGAPWRSVDFEPQLVQMGGGTIPNFDPN